MVYNVSATMTFASSRIRVGMISGSATNRASDGIVKMMLAVNVVIRRSTARRHTNAPSGTAISSPSAIGTSESLR